MHLRHRTPIFRRTLCLTTLFCVPDITCQPITGKPRRLLIVPSCVTDSRWDNAASLRLIAPQVILHVNKLFGPLANLPSPAPVVMSDGLSRCKKSGCGDSPEKRLTLLADVFKCSAILLITAIRSRPFRLCMSALTSTVPRTTCMPGTQSISVAVGVC